MTIDQLLNLQGIVIKGYRHLENIGIVFEIEAKNKKAICPRCGQVSEKLHQNHRPKSQGLAHVWSVRILKS